MCESGGCDNQHESHYCQHNLHGGTEHWCDHGVTWWTPDPNARPNP